MPQTPTKPAEPKPEKIRFTVDAALLAELGERLVGKPHIALAELVKNGYDADARRVEIKVGRDEIEIVDDGHGMTREEFEQFWMRVGSPHKRVQQRSRELHRPLTGSKGVGRLAVQFLARHVTLTTAVKGSPTVLTATVDWTNASRAGDLTRAEADVVVRQEEATFAEGRPHGTRIRLSRLNQQWQPESFRELAREIWWLRPPFGAGEGQQSSQFDVTMTSSVGDIADEFQKQLNAIFDIWTARVVGKLTRETRVDKETGGTSRKARVSLTFDDQTIERAEYWIEDCHLDRAEYEVRIYNLVYRQPYGIKVAEARDYFKQYGGVHVYDSGFRLPYYGRKDQDWLEIEQAHSQR